MKNATPKQKSNRGPKPGKTTILTSPENVATLKENHGKRKAAAEQKEKNAAKKLKNTPKKDIKTKQASTAPKKAVKKNR